jgi:hypothetical protein
MPAGLAVRIFLAFAFTYFFSALLRAVTATLAPAFSAEMGLRASDLGLLAGAYVLALLGTARRRTPPEWVTVLLPLGYLAMISCSPKIASRYLLPVSTLLPLLATLGAAEIAGVVRAADSRWRRAAGAAVLAGLAGWIVWTELPPLRTALAGVAVRRGEPVPTCCGGHTPHRRKRPSKS